MWLLFFSLLVFVKLLLEGGSYFFGKPAIINDGWTVVGTASHSLVSCGNESYNTNSPSATSLVTVVRNDLHTCAYTSCSYYSRVASI